VHALYIFLLLLASRSVRRAPLAGTAAVRGRERARQCRTRL